MSDAELRHLAALAAVADEGSFGRAAARLGYSQSTISQQIAALEKAVGGAVFDRPGGPKPVRITPLGALVLAHGRDLLAKAAAMAAALDRFKAGDGRVDIGTFQSVSNVILPPVVRRLREEHPGCDIRLFEEETDQPQVSDLDLMFFDGRVDGDVQHLKLLDDPYLLVARPGPSPAARCRWPGSTARRWWPTRRSAIRPGSSRNLPAAPSGRTSCSAPWETKPCSPWCEPEWGRRSCHGSPSSATIPALTRHSPSTNSSHRYRRARSSCSGKRGAPTPRSPPGPSRSPSRW